MKEKNTTVRSLVVLGDSIAYGKWDKDGGWVRRLQKGEWERLEGNVEGPGAFVFNLSIPGETILGVRSRLAEVTPRVSKSQENAVIIAVGTNDCKFDNSTRQCKVSDEVFEENLRAVVHVLKQQNIKVVLLGLLKVDEVASKQFTKYTFSNELLRSYDAMIKKVGESEAVLYISFEDMLSELMLHDDGIHLDDVSHQKISERVRKQLQDNHIF